ncbi:MAG: 4-(cytidine 5'-diphospho)-2-C-methyl-D-erythritol kinase [Pseudomonadota bacterium]
MIYNIVKSYAKLNFRLDILNKRYDGYHNIKSLFVPIDLHDELNFEFNENGKIKIECPEFPELTNDNNLICKAIKLINEKLSLNIGANIKLNKNIPLGAGLGGGSSNCAITIKKINEEFKLNLSNNELINLGALLGADVPFFIGCKPSIITGIGDEIKKIEFLSKLKILLVKPNFSIDTKFAYTSLNLKLTKSNCDGSYTRFFRGISEFNYDSDRLLNSDIGTKLIKDFMSNDLEKAVINEYSQIKDLKSLLIENRAITSLMTGSGSVVFGIFRDETSLNKAFKNLKECNGLLLYKTSTF